MPALTSLEKHEDGRDSQVTGSTEELQLLTLRVGWSLELLPSLGSQVLLQASGLHSSGRRWVSLMTPTFGCGLPLKVQVLGTWILVVMWELRGPLRGGPGE